MFLIRLGFIHELTHFLLNIFRKHLDASSKTNFNLMLVETFIIDELVNFFTENVKEFINLYFGTTKILNGEAIETGFFYL